MDPQTAIDLGRQAMLETLVVSLPALLTALAVGLLVGLLQALTQVQEQTVSFVPKLAAMFAVLALTLPWLIARLVDYTRDLYTAIPDTLR
jgi:flagellar biosynthetic protein FliQ